MYESPIELIQKLKKQMDLDLENKIVSAVQEVGISVDKHELERALAYDRDQYDKGFADGRQSIFDELGIAPFQYEILKMAIKGEYRKEEV